jgi:putative ABC transport system ATP-binding protein
MIRREQSAQLPEPGSGAAGTPEQTVALRHVSKAYTTGGQPQPVLRDFSLDILPGEFVAVLGPSGCGKTTLLNLLGGLDRADSGSIRVCGHDLSNAGPAELTAYRARSVGFVFQFYNLLPTLTVLENVEAGVTVAGIPRDQARVMLGRVGLAGAARKFPAQLSGGEQQRVAIARALAKSPQLVLADEPTGNLDQATASEVLVLMRELNQQSGTTFVVVSHNPAVAAMGTRVVQLGDGRIIADGRP